MTMNRRGFLKGLLSSVAAGVLLKNGLVQPEQMIATPERRVFDMAANTWRREWTTTLITGFNGHIGHCAVWNRLLTRTEIRKLSDLPSPQHATWNIYERAVLKSAPVAYWPSADGHLEQLDDAEWITVARMPRLPNWSSRTNSQEDSR